MIKKDERGFTLLELIIAIGLAGIITAGISATLLQTITGSSRTSNHMVVVREVQQAGYWVSFYAYMAQAVEVTGPSGFPLKLQWFDWETNKDHKVNFSMADNLKVSYEPEETWGNFGRIPEFNLIDTSKTNCKFSGGSAFYLPYSGNSFEIVDRGTPDSGRIFVTDGSISVTPTGDAEYDPGTGEWETHTIGDTIIVTATSNDTKGGWTSETQAAVAAITAGEEATLSNGKVLVFEVTATGGTGRQEVTETRIYEVMPKLRS